MRPNCSAPRRNKTRRWGSGWRRCWQRRVRAADRRSRGRSRALRHPGDLRELGEGWGSVGGCAMSAAGRRRPGASTLASTSRGAALLGRSHLGGVEGLPRRPEVLARVGVMLVRVRSKVLGARLGHQTPREQRAAARGGRGPKQPTRGARRVARAVVVRDGLGALGGAAARPAGTHPAGAVPERRVAAVGVQR